MFKKENESGSDKEKDGDNDPAANRSHIIGNRGKKVPKVTTQNTLFASAPKAPYVTTLDSLIVPSLNDKTKENTDNLYNAGMYDGDDINADDSA